MWLKDRESVEMHFRATRVKIRHLIIRNDGVIVKKTKAYFRYPFRAGQLMEEIKK